ASSPERAVGGQSSASSVLSVPTSSQCHRRRLALRPRSGCPRPTGSAPRAVAGADRGRQPPEPEEALGNTTQQIGRLAADPDAIRDTERGRVTTFRLAVALPDGSSKRADFFTVEVWNRLADTCATYLREGREVPVQGRLEQRVWRTKDDE